MKRTVRLATLPLNPGKQAEIRSVVATYTDTKRQFVGRLRSSSMWRHFDDKRGFRNWAKHEGLYPKDINVHLVDQAAFDAADTCIRHIESCIERAHTKARIWRRFADENERHYAYACLARYSALGEIMIGGTPELDAGGLSAEARAKVASYLHRVLRAVLTGTWPTVQRSRQMALDETLYTTFVVERPGSTPNKRQYVSIIGAQPHKRIIIPLAGISRVSGNIRVVLDEDGDRAAIHVTYDLPSLGKATGDPVSIDWGVTEVCTDNAGRKHGQGYGPALMSMTERRNKTGKSRGKLRAISKKDAGSKKAKHIARHNLGTKKQEARLRRNRATLRTISGAAVKEVVYADANWTRSCGRLIQAPEQRPRTIVTEDLSRLRGKAKSKKISRMRASWARSENKERITVHAYIGSSDVKTANAAYTSQMCPDPGCGYVHKDNRNGDTFHCRNPHWDCNWQGDADHVAATNLLARIDDREISRFTPYTEVKKILDERFLRRMESRTGGQDAVPGAQRQRDATSKSGVQVLSVDGDATAHGRTPSKPRRRKPVVGDDHMVADRLSPGFMDEPGETQRLESEKKRSA